MVRPRSILSGKKNLLDPIVIVGPHPIYGSACTSDQCVPAVGMPSRQCQDLGWMKNENIFFLVDMLLLLGVVVGIIRPESKVLQYFIYHRLGWVHGWPCLCTPREWHLWLEDHRMLTATRLVSHAHVSSNNFQQHPIYVIGCRWMSVSALGEPEPHRKP